MHIGLPKTATSYLQTIIWSNRDLLRERGVVVPGAERRDHLWSSRTVREQASHERAPEHQRQAWTRVRDELAGVGRAPGWSATSSSPRPPPSRRWPMVAALAPAEVHLVVTAREPLGLFTASWQESLKNGATTPMAEYARTVSEKPTDIWNWRTLDLRLVLERWTAAVPPERVHVLVLDPAAPREDVWHRFAGIVGFPTDGIDLSGSFPNTSMGVAEAETLRRVNGRLTGFGKAFDKGVYLRTYLADERLVPRGGERFWPEPDQVEDCRRRGEEAVAYLARSAVRRRRRPRAPAGAGAARAAAQHHVGDRRRGRRRRGRPGRDHAGRRTRADRAGPRRRQPDRPAVPRARAVQGRRTRRLSPSLRPGGGASST